MTTYEYDTLQVETSGGVTQLILNCPEKKNALSAQMIAELTQVAQQLGTDITTRVVVLSGAGDVFCAGGDLAWMRAQIDADRATRVTEARKLAEMLSALNTMPKPLLGRVHGGAFGGGIGMLCICDYVVAEAGTKFGLTETRLGLIPATIGPYVMARLGEGMARRVFMSGRVFGVDEAQSLGMIAEAAQASDMDARVDQQIAPYLYAAPYAVGAAKELTRALGPVIDETVIEASIRRLADIWEDPGASEGIAAFFERRKPAWVSDQ